MTMLTTGDLERRLRQLDLVEPDPEDVTRRVLARARRRPRARRWKLAGIPVFAVLVLVGMNLVAAVYVPRYAQVLGDVPIASAFLQQAGLATVSGRVSSFGDVSEASGVRVELLAGYADAARTVLLVRQSPVGRLVPNDGTFRLRDQFGNDYRLTASVANTETGEAAMTFEPFRWPASLTGARFDLRFSRIDVGPAGPSAARTGNWTVRGTLAQDEGTDLQLPGPQRLGNLQVIFTSLRALPGGLAVTAHVSGASVGELTRVVPDGQKGHAAFQVQLVDPSGIATRLQSLDMRDTLDGPEMRALWLFEGHGGYGVVFAYEGAGSVTVPVDLIAGSRTR